MPWATFPNRCRWRGVSEYIRLTICNINYCAAGVRLDGFLAESEGLSGDLDLRHFATNYQVSSVKSGSGNPPDRAQICSFVDVAV